MKKYKNKLEEYFEKLLQYKGKYIFDDDHSLARFKERMPQLPEEIYYDYLKKIIDWVLTKNRDDKEERFIFISKKYNFGIQMHWREDRKGIIKGFNGYTSTTLSQKELTHVLMKDRRIFLEQALKEGFKEKEINNAIDKAYLFYDLPKYLQEEIGSYESFYECGKHYFTFVPVKL